MSYLICKKIDFCYGHRLMEYSGVCNRIHGHNATVEIVLESKTLNKIGMVEDFTTVKDVAKQFIEETFDHRLLLRYDDPLIESLEQKNESYLEVIYNPTAENISKHIFNFLSIHFKDILVAVRVHETNSSYAEFTRE